jgi:hypothetical protein
MFMPSEKILGFYTKSGPMTTAGKHEASLKELPDDISDLVEIIQGLFIYDVVAPDFYGCPIPESRQAEIHIRPVEGLLDGIFALDNQPLTIARPPEKRLVGRCHHFMLLLVAALRAKGIPARGRWGFGSYFNPGTFEDHDLCEYWNSKEKRWVLVDTQFDKIWQKKLHIKHDVLDVPRDHFLISADAWKACRTGKKDPSKFGISFDNIHGLWFIAGSLIRDVASLNKMEMLPWDGWGPMPRPNNQMQDKRRLAFFDHLAELTSQPDEHFDELRKLYADTEKRLKVPDRVFNALRRHLETV